LLFILVLVLDRKGRGDVEGVKYTFLSPDAEDRFGYGV
jgi:hypothetical protein